MKRNVLRWVTILALVTMLFSGIGIKDDPPIVLAQGPVNLALGKSAFASSTSGTNVAAKATDGLFSTYWSSTNAEPAWIYVDLGAVLTIKQVILIWESAYGRNYRIEGSTDAVAWTTLAEIVNGNGGSDYIEVGGAWRYIRMYGTRRGTGWGFGLLEFEVYENAQPVPIEYPAPPAPAPRATGSQLFSDDFNDTSIDDWQIITGDWQSITGALSTAVPCNAGPYQIVAGNTSWGDYQVSLDFKRTNGWDYGGILLRYSSTGFYRVDINPSIPYGGWVKLYKSPNTELATRSWPFIKDKWDRIIIDVEGPTIQIYVVDANQNAELVLSYTDPSPILNGKIGFASAAGAICPVQVQYDNVLVKSVIPSFSVSGTILDDSGNPIPMVDLSLNNSDVTTFTDAAGNYFLQRIPYGAYTLFADKPGYKFSPDSTGITGGPNMTAINFTGAHTNWTLMYYLAADNNNPNDPYTIIFNQLEEAAGNPYVNIIVVWDTFGEFGTQYYEVKSNSNINQPADYIEGKNMWSKGELNMGDPDTLIAFTNWAMLNYPADHFALILDDHGSGLMGAMFDATNRGDYLSLKEISTGLSAISSEYATPTGKKIDVLVMNACLMAMLEDAYQFKDYIDYYVASENLQWDFSTGYYETANSVSQHTTPLELGNLFQDKYANEMASRHLPAYTMSVADISKIDALINTINQMALHINSNIGQHTDELATVLTKVQRFNNNNSLSTGIDRNDDFIDLYDFARLIKEEFENQDIKQSAQAVMDAVQIYIPHESHEWFRDVGNSHGVSIYFPTSRSSFYNVENYNFAVGAIWNPSLQSNLLNTKGETPPILWGSFLVNYINLVNPNGPDRLDPPPLVNKPEPFNYRIYFPLLLK